MFCANRYGITKHMILDKYLSVKESYAHGSSSTRNQHIPQQK